MAEHAYTTPPPIVRRSAPPATGATDERPAILSVDGKRFMLILDGIVLGLALFLTRFWIAGGGQ